MSAVKPNPVTVSPSLTTDVNVGPNMAVVKLGENEGISEIGYIKKLLTRRPFHSSCFQEKNQKHIRPLLAPRGK